MRQFRISNCEFRIGSTAIFAAALALGLLAAPFPSQGQQPAKVYRIGFLSTAGYETNPKTCPIQGSPNWQGFMAGLREHGYIQGHNLVLECRYTEGREERAPVLAADLVTLKMDLLIAAGTPQVRAAKQATSTIPIVMVSLIDPVRRGLVASLAHPGGNVTGLTDMPAMSGKRLQLLKEAVPKLSRVAVFEHLVEPPEPDFFRKEREEEARALGVTLQLYGVRTPEEFAGAFAAMTKARVGGLLMVPDLSWVGHEQRIVALAAQSRLPAIYHNKDFVTAGGLMSYAVNYPDMYRRLGIFVEKIFHGANPGDIPVEEPTKFDLLINGKTAKALGLTIPPSLLMRGAEVVE